MRNPSYLMLSRHQIYYFRWPLPLKQHGKTTHIKLSLDTREPREALRLSTLLQDQAYNLLRQDWVLAMDYSQIKGMVEAHLAKVLDARKRDIDQHGPMPPRARMLCERAVKGIEDSFDANIDFSMFSEDDSDLAELVHEYQLDLSKSEEDRNNLKRLYWKAAQALTRELIAYSDNAEKFDFKTSTVKGNSSIVTLPKPENRLDKVVEKFMTEMAKSQTWGIRATDERRDCFEYLMELIGRDFDLPRFDVVEARGVKEALQKTPVNRRKLKQTRDLPLTEQLKVEGVPTLSTGSINKYLQCFSSLFTWAVAHGYAEKNPFAGISMKDEGKKKRDYFRPEQVQQLLDEATKKKSDLFDNDMKRWGTLIALYTGARLNEVSSLTPADVKQDKKSGIWYFDINDEEEQKRLKTDAAKRLVPVHSQLIELGFLKFVEKVRGMKGDSLRLLYALTYSEKEGWGRKLGRWFNDVCLPQLKLKKAGTSFHSLRHTVITNLRRAGVDNHNVRAIVGHEPDGVTEAVYTHDIGLPQLKRDIERLNYSPEDQGFKN